MNRLQIIVLGVSVVAFGGAYFVFNNYLGSQRKAPLVVQSPRVQTDKVLIAAQDIPMGSVVNDTLVTWQDWPKDAISDLMITKSAERFAEGPTSSRARACSCQSTKRERGRQMICVPTPQPTTRDSPV